MKISNKTMLITYSDCMGNRLGDLHGVLEGCLQGTFGGVHVLPFYPSSGDRGFAPITYDEVDPKFGSWDDVEKIARNHYFMADFMINHISKRSSYYKDFQQNKDRSAYRDFFIRYKDFWPEQEPTQRDIEKIFLRHRREPSTEITFADGSKEKLWCTFSDEQIDLNIDSPAVKKFIEESLAKIIGHGISVIRLDAIAFVNKKAGSRCFFLEPELWDTLRFVDGIIRSHGASTLVEIHTDYERQLQIAKTGVYVYDFVLPLLVLHTLYTGSSEKLLAWLGICPHNQFTVLDTHDGIGISDAAGILSPEEIKAARDTIFEKSGVKRDFTYNEDYQINCTYYAALGHNDSAYLLARAIQFFTPGIPQLYYVGLLNGRNDTELAEATGEGRNVNRHNYSLAEIERQTESPSVQKLLALMKFRNLCSAFCGTMAASSENTDSQLTISWTNGSSSASLHANLNSFSFHITCKDDRPEVQTLLKQINGTV